MTARNQHRTSQARPGVVDPPGEIADFCYALPPDIIPGAGPKS
jgi:hypothetical protein